MSPLIFQFTSDALAPLQCDTEPVGWDSLKYLLARDTKRHGVMLSVSVDLTFVKEAAAYLRLVYDGGTDGQGTAIAARGVEGLVVLTVYEQDPNELQPVEIYRGQMDFLSYKSAETGVSCRFREVGFAAALLSRDDAEVDLLGNESLSGIALPAYAPVLARLHSQQTLQRFEMSQAAKPDPAPTLHTTDADDSVLFFFGMDQPILNEFGIEPFATGPVAGRAGGPVNVPFYTAKANGRHTFAFHIILHLTILQQVAASDFNEIDFKWEFKHVLGGVETILPLARIHDLPPFRNDLYPRGNFPGGDFPSDSAAYRFEALRILELDMEVGDTAWLYSEAYVHDWSGFGPNNAKLIYEVGLGSYLRVSAPTVVAAADCPGLLVHEVLARCCEAATDQRDAFYSEYYGRTDTRVPYAQDGAGALRLVTSGFQLRGFPLPSAPAPLPGTTDTRKSLSCSLNTAYNSLDAIDCLGQGIEQRNGRPVVRVEPRAHFYQEAEVLRLGAVTDLKKGPYAEWLYNETRVGYPRWQSGAPNGLDEFNGVRSYALPLTQLKKTYTITSSLHAAGYLIEQARRDVFSAGNTKEGQADAEPFLICLHRAGGTGFVSEQAEAFVPGSITGILAGNTAYNLRLSPGRMLYRHGPWLRAGLTAQTTKRLLRGKVEGNAHLVSQLLGEAAPLDEFQDVPVAELSPPIVVAETYEFSVRLRRGHMAQLQKNPYGRVSFLDGLGTRKSGYLLRAERTPQSGLTSFTLLRAAA